MNCKKAKVLIISILVLATLGCQRSDPYTPPPRSLIIQIVHPPEIQNYMNAMRDEYIRRAPSLPDQSALRIELMNEGGLNAAKKLARGELKVHAWLAPSTSLINYTNSHLENLGARQIDCTKLFSTPVVAAIQPQYETLARASNHSFAWQDTMEAQLGSQPQLSLTHTLPLSSGSGLAALIQLAYMAALKDQLSVGALKAPSVYQKLIAYERLVTTYSGSEEFLFTKASSGVSKRARILLTTEQQVAMFNTRHGGNVPVLKALYMNEGSYIEDYSLCLSQADWLNEGHRAALRGFTDFLSSDFAQNAVRQIGFRPALTKANSQYIPAHGVDYSKPHKHLEPIPAEVLDYLLEEWPILMRPAATVLILDSSASMQGNPSFLGKQMFRTILAESRPADLKALIAFATEPHIVSPFSADAVAIMGELDGIRAVGGSAIYDALRTAIGLVTQEKVLPYRKNILLYTDGQDKNSVMSLNGLLNLLETKISQYDINVTIVALASPGVNFTDLQKVVQVSDGVFREGALAQIEGIFREVGSGL